jgi:tripartite-type tricarboxylate transporter receptor subunit TctC
MKFPRRRFLHLATGTVALPAISRIARAQTYPGRPVRIVVGFAPGAFADTYARLIGQWLSEHVGNPFIIENRAGAGGNVGTEFVVRAPPDGYTLLLCGSSDAWNATLYENLKFNFVRDIAPVASISRGTGVIVVHPSFPSRSVSELIAYANRNPGKITVASGGIGSSPHIFYELFKKRAGVDMLHVPYRGGGPAITDLLGGQVQVMFATVTSTIEHIKTGRLRALAVTSAARSELLPDLPTVSEFVAEYEATLWLGIGAPRNTPAAIIGRLNTAINAGLADPRLKQRIVEFGDAVFASSPADLGKFIVEDTEKWAKVVRAANIKVE